MKRKFLLTILIASLCLICFSLLKDPAAFFNNITTTLQIWCLKVYPSVFTFYILSSCLINFNIFQKITNFLYKYIKLDTTKGKEIFLISMLIGNPSSSMLIFEEMEKCNITGKDANTLIKIASFFNPLFVLIFINSYYKNYLFISAVIIFSSIFANIILFIFITRKEKYKRESFKSKPLTLNLPSVLNSIDNVIKLLLMISGIMVLCSILKYSMAYTLELLHFNNIFTDILLSHIETSTGLNDLMKMSINDTIKLSLCSFMVSFGSISIHMQVYNIISKTNMKYKVFVKYRLLQGIIAFLLTLLIFLNKIWIF